MDDDYGARAISDGLLQRRKIDLPSVIVEQRVRNKLDVFEFGEKFEKRIARIGDENFLAGIAEQAEDERVTFAGARGEDEAFGIRGACMLVVVVGGDCGA